MICRIAAGLMLVALIIGRVAPADPQGSPPAKSDATPPAVDAQATPPAKPDATPPAADAQATPLAKSDGDPALVWATYVLVGVTGVLGWMTQKLVFATTSVAMETKSLVNATEALAQSTEKDFKRRKELETAELWGEVRLKIEMPSASKLKTIQENTGNTGKRNRNDLRKELRLLEFFANSVNKNLLDYDVTKALSVTWLVHEYDKLANFIEQAQTKNPKAWEALKILCERLKTDAVADQAPDELD